MPAVPPVEQSGNVTPGHMATWATTGVIQDSGLTPAGSIFLSPNAIKTPCLVATTGSNITLSGLQIVDGVQLVAGNRVLVKDQTNAVQNGIYLAANAQWPLASDAMNVNPNTDLVVGTLVPVTSGSINSGTIFVLVAASPNPVIIGTSTLTFFVFNSLNTQINAQTGTSYTLQSSDNGKLVSLSNSGAVTVTLPNSLPQGFNCILEQEGAGQVGVSAAAGATLQSAFSNQHTTTQYSMVFLVVLTNTTGGNASWRMGGDMVL